MVANGTKIVDKASEWLLNQSIKYVEILASEKATLPKKKMLTRIGGNLRRSSDS